MEENDRGDEEGEFLATDSGATGYTNEYQEDYREYQRFLPHLRSDRREDVDWAQFYRLSSRLKPVRPAKGLFPKGLPNSKCDADAPKCREQ